MNREHHYQVAVRWTGNLGTGTSAYRAYSRAHEVSIPGKPLLLGSADPAFRGEVARWTPEDLLVAALAQCHLLSYLHVAATAGVIVTGYRDEATATMRLSSDGTGQLVEAMLHPRVTVAEEHMIARANELHEAAHTGCFIARSVNFPVRHQPAASTAHAV